MTFRRRQRLGFRVQSGLDLKGFGFRVEGLGFAVWRLSLWILGAARIGLDLVLLGEVRWGAWGRQLCPTKMGFEATPASKSQDSVGFGEARTIRQAL